MTFPYRHPGFDPGSMNTRIREFVGTVFMNPDFCQDDAVGVRA